MSREERRQYQRMMRNAERGPALPPAARARQERVRARRATQRTETSLDLTPRFWAGAIAVAAVAGLLGLSVQWGEGMPWAGYVGLVVAVIALAVQVGIRLLRRRARSG